MDIMEQTVNGSPMVSIVIPVYNVEKTLYHCLASVVFQTLPETEVIVVNDATPDNSQTIIDDFIARFPEKVRCIVHEENQGLAYARRTGLRNARAPYVVFLDSDDFISGDLCQVLLEQMTADDLDLLYYPAARFWEGSKEFDWFYPPMEAEQGNLIRKGFAAFWGAMYRREFLLEQEQIAFQPIYFEDAASTPSLLSRTDKIGVYRKKALYFYRFGRVDSITASQMTRKKMQDMFRADEIGFENVLPEFMEDYAFRVMKRSNQTLMKETAIYDYSVGHFREMTKCTSPYDVEFPEDVQKQLVRMQELPEEITIPKRVFVNGFLKKKLKDFDRYVQEAARAYLFDPEVVILDETTCDMAALPGWLKDAAKEEVGLYFAVKAIAEKGGMYVSPAVRVTSSFNREAFRGAFFVAGPETTVLPCAFGAEPNHPALTSLAALLNRESVAWKRNTVADCMAHTLIGESGVHLTGLEEKGLHNLHMLRFCDVCGGIHADKSYCVLNYGNFISESADTVVLPQELLDFAWRLAREEMLELEASLKKEKEAARRERKRRRNAESELDRIRSNLFFRIAKRIWHLVPQKIREGIRK